MDWRFLPWLTRFMMWVESDPSAAPAGAYGGGGGGGF
jgi:hypothetical protein